MEEQSPVELGGGLADDDELAVPWDAAAPVAAVCAWPQATTSSPIANPRD